MIVYFPLGASPQIVTETLLKLKDASIDEVVVIHTSHPSVQEGVEKLREIMNKKFPGIKFTPVMLPFSDLDSPGNNEKFVETLFDEILKRNRPFIMSIAGGRKSMGAYAFLAAQIFGAEKVVHVLVPPEIEKSGDFLPPEDRISLVEIPCFDFSFLREKVLGKSGKEILEALRSGKDMIEKIAEVGMEEIYPPPPEEELHDWHGFLYLSPIMRKLIKKLEVYVRDIKRGNLKTILIYGETGTGKNVLAEAISRAAGLKKYRRFSMSEVPQTLLDGLLFGVEKGVATDVRERDGVIACADGGTLFIDEIGDAPFGIQLKLLNVIETGKVVKVGGVKEREVEVLFIAATNRKPEEFLRPDLYHRFQGILKLPPLRERKEEIIPFARYFAGKKISPEVEELLLKYPWPGNIRQLRHTMEELARFSGDVITPDIVREYTPFLISHSEKECILHALEKCGWNIKRTAEHLGISRSTLYRRIKKLGIDIEHIGRQKKAEKPGK